MSLLRRAGVALRSLRWRLTLSYVGLIAVLLAGLGVFQYETLRDSLINSHVSERSFDLTTAERLYAASGETGQTDTQKVALLASLMSQASGARVAVAVYGPAGAMLLVRPAGSTPPSLAAPVFQALVSQGVQRHEVVSTSSGDELVAGFPLGKLALRRTAAVLETSEPMTPIDNVLSGDLTMLVLGGAAMLLLALIIGLLLTGRTLRPLRRLTATAGRLAGGDLRARTQLLPRGDEVGQLATAFDHMADRIEGAFAAQSESEAKVRRFIADASHELRTPVTALSGYLEVLRRGAAHDQATLASALASMAREAERLRLLVTDLLTLARVDAQGAHTAEDFDVVPALGRLLDEGVPGMPERLDRDLPPAPVVVRCDRTALTAIVRNLLVNACRYAPGARQLWSVTNDGRRARIDAHDDGPGIPAADLPHVFERFYRGEKTRVRVEGGTGLGLAIVQGLARAQGGDAAITSSEGAGTTVTVWLPLAPVGRPAAG
ncbi:MAG: HAMP domain-containing sensor histidine kinase [Candidatus Dormibacteria bacterium]